MGLMDRSLRRVGVLGVEISGIVWDHAPVERTGVEICWVVGRAVLTRLEEVFL